MTDKYAVIGNPIAHSKSPLIHQMFAAQTGQDISYEAILVPLNGFRVKIEQLIKDHYKGCNVTVPFKFKAYLIANGVSSEVVDAIDSGADADAVNTLVFQNGEIIGYNTDGIGLVCDITQNLDFDIAGKRVLLMGAGGAAYGVAGPLLDQLPSELVVANRNLHKAEMFVKKIRGVPPNPESAVSVVRKSYPELMEEKFDIVINATSSSLSDEMPPLPPGIFADGALAYDMMYGKETLFMKFARENGAAIVTDGLGMLVEQAGEAFFIWRGIRPKTAPVIAALRGQQ